MRESAAIFPVIKKIMALVIVAALGIGACVLMTPGEAHAGRYINSGFVTKKKSNTPRVTLGHKSTYFTITHKLDGRTGCKPAVQTVTVKPKADNVIVEGNTYMLKSAVGPQYLDISKSNKRDGANAQIWGYVKGSTAQVWRVEHMRKDGYFALICVNSGKALDVKAAGTRNGTNVQQWAYNGTDAQLWRVETTKYGGFMLINKNSGKCLDVANGVDRAGVNVQIHQKNNARAQSWTFKVM